jgi:hypothetical protein
MHGFPAASRVDGRLAAPQFPAVIHHRKPNPRMQQPSPRDDRPSSDRRFGDLNAVLLTLAIGLAVLDGTCFAALKLIHTVAPLIHVVPDAGRAARPDHSPQSAKP